MKALSIMGNISSIGWSLYIYRGLRDLTGVASDPEAGIKSTGYVVDSLEAAVWSLIRTDSFKDCMLTAVNLGDDSDTVGAIAGGLAALYYGYDGIPGEWLAVIKRREWIEDLCKMERSEVRDE